MRTLLSLALCCLTSGLALAQAPTASSPPSVSDAEARAPELKFQQDGEYVVLDFSTESVRLVDLIDVASQVTHHRFAYQTALLRDTTVPLRGEQRIAKARFFGFFQDCVKMLGFYLQPMRSGSNGSGPSQSLMYSILGNRGGPNDRPGIAKTESAFLTESEISAHEFDSALVYTTTFPLAYVNAQEATNMLQSYLTDPLFESCRAVTNSNAIIVTGFGTTLSTLRTLLRQIDVERKVSTRATEILHLSNVAAAEIEPILVEQMNIGGFAPNSGNLPQEVAVSISADLRTNSIVLAGTEAQIQSAKAIVAGLDRKVDDAIKMKIVTLSNGDANEIAETLQKFADALDSGSAPQPGPKKGEASPPRKSSIAIVAHAANNSIILRAPSASFDELLVLLGQLDSAKK